eukprot:gene7723-1736_t
MSPGRYTCDPKQLFSWFEPYLGEREMIAEAGVEKDAMALGQWLSRLLLEQEYHDTMHPRMPMPVLKDITAKIEELEAKKGAPPGRRDDGGRGDERDGGY